MHPPPLSYVPAVSRCVSFIDGPTEPVSLLLPGKANILARIATVASNVTFSNCRGSFSFNDNGKKEERWTRKDDNSVN